MKMLSSGLSMSGSGALLCGLFLAVSQFSEAIELIYSLSPTENDFQFGSAFVGLGDLTGDGVADFAVADQSHNSGGSLLGSGIVYVISGADGVLIRSYVGDPAQSQFFGISLAALDADLDGVLDLAVGAAGHSEAGGYGAGAVWVYSGVDGSKLSVTTGAAGSQYGSSLANAGDHDGDGVDDLFVGAPLAGGSQGAVVLQSGADGLRLAEVLAPVMASSFGSAVAAVGDCDGDGRQDLAVGAPGFSDGSYQAGQVTVYRSSDWQRAGEIRGAGFYHRLGSFLAPVGDADGDGKCDLMVGSYSGGSCMVVSSADLEVIADLSIADLAPYQQMVPGGCLDADGDGVADWLVGTTALETIDGSPHGGLRIHSGVDGAVIFEAVAAEAFSGFGRTLGVLPGLGFIGGEWSLMNPATGGKGAAHVWKVAAAVLDSDGDGVIDSEDECPDSILDPTVLIGGIDSGVENRVDERGRSIADILAEAVGDPDDYPRLIRYFVKFNRTVWQLYRNGVIDRTEFRRLRSAAVVSVILDRIRGGGRR